MAEVTGKDIVDMMAEGIETFVKDHIRQELIKTLVSQFEDEITMVIDKKLSEMIFNAYSQENPHEMRKELGLLIEWSKGQAEYKRKYELVSELVEE